ncbi:hypothetical protein ALT1644_200050 [Alteromonas macleodii]
MKWHIGFIRDVFSPFTPTYYASQIVYYPTFILSQITNKQRMYAEIRY